MTYTTKLASDFVPAIARLCQFSNYYIRSYHTTCKERCSVYTRNELEQTRPTGVQGSQCSHRRGQVLHKRS